MPRCGRASRPRVPTKHILWGYPHKAGGPGLRHVLLRPRRAPSPPTPTLAQPRRRRRRRGGRSRCFFMARIHGARQSVAHASHILKSGGSDRGDPNGGGTEAVLDAGRRTTPRACGGGAGAEAGRRPSPPPARERSPPSGPPPAWQHDSDAGRASRKRHARSASRRGGGAGGRRPRASYPSHPSAP